MAHNSMIKVNGSWIRTPSSFEWSVNDVSASDAGRDQSGKMYKGRITRKRKIILKWTGLTPGEAAPILDAFSKEYFTVTYFDPLDNRTNTRTFYSGDQTVPFKTWSVNNRLYSEVRFDIIER